LESSPYLNCSQILQIEYFNKFLLKIKAVSQRMPSVPIDFIIFNRIIFKLKNSRIHEPQNNINPHKFYLAFSQKNILKIYILKNIKYCLFR
jgi:hypothetical protein